MDLLAPYLTQRNAVLAVVLVVAFLVVRRLFARKVQPSYVVPGRCASCGWVGSVSKYNAKCPKCASAISP